MAVHCIPFEDRAFGATIQGMDLEAPITPEDQAELRRLWAEHGLLVWRGAGASAEAQVRLSAVFGVNEKHMVPELWVEGFPTLISLRASPDLPSEDNDIYEVDGVALAGFKPWHSDLVHQQHPNRGSMLRAVLLPAEGGDTAFCDRMDAYARLPDALRARIDSLRVIYAVVPNAANIRYDVRKQIKAIQLSARVEDYDRRAEEFAKVTQPLVPVLPETGKKYLHLSPWFAVGIEGMEGAEGDDLLQELVDHLTADRSIYTHKWSAGDLVLWDNWRLVHMAYGTPPWCSRELHRTTIRGEWNEARAYPYPN